MDITINLVIFILSFISLKIIFKLYKLAAYSEHIAAEYFCLDAYKAAVDVLSTGTKLVKLYLVSVSFASFMACE